MNESDILRAVLEHAPESLVILDVECRIIAFNQGLASLLEAYFRQKPEIGDDYNRFVPVPHHEIFRSSFLSALQGEHVVFDCPTEFEENVYWFHNEVSPLCNQEGMIVGVIFSFKDITQETLYHQALEIQASTMQHLFDQASDSMVLLDLEKKIIRLNQYAKDSIQYLRNLTPEMGREFDYYLDPINRPIFQHLFQEALQGKAIEQEMSAMSVDHQEYWFKIRTNPVYHVSGKLVGVTVISEYITEQKKVESYLAESEARFRSILYAMPIPIIVLGGECEITGINPYAQRLFRWTEQNILGKPIDILIPPDFREDLLISSWDSLLFHLTDPSITHEVMEIRLPPNSQQSFFEVYANGFEFRDKKQTVVMFSDITNHIESSRVIQEHLDTLREVAYVQSHVIRSSLTKILGLANILLTDEHITAVERHLCLLHLTESGEELDAVIQKLVDRIGR